jgi:hypothetical protein
MHRRLGLVALALLSACGGSTAAVKAAAPSPTVSSAPGATSSQTGRTPVITGTEEIVANSPLPPVATVDLHTNGIVRLDWVFWAPH